LNEFFQRFFLRNQFLQCCHFDYPNIYLISERHGMAAKQDNTPIYQEKTRMVSALGNCSKPRASPNGASSVYLRK
jgi:hypothetical protein